MWIVKKIENHCYGLQHCIRHTASVEFWIFKENTAAVIMGLGHCLCTPRRDISYRYDRYDFRTCTCDQTFCGRQTTCPEPCPSTSLTVVLRLKTLTKYTDVWRRGRRSNTGPTVGQVARCNAIRFGTVSGGCGVVFGSYSMCTSCANAERQQ
jgi:hypothetical protein